MKLDYSHVDQSTFVSRIKEKGQKIPKLFGGDEFAVFNSLPKYETVQELLHDVPYAEHFFAWSPGMMGIGAARRQGSDERYLRDLAERKRIIVFRGEMFDIEHDDRLEFVVNNSVWEASKFSIKSRNLEEYESVNNGVPVKLRLYITS